MTGWDRAQREMEINLITYGDKLNVDAVLFDLDGTLLDSIGIYYEIVDIVFEKLRLPPVPKERFVEAAKDGDFEWDYVLPADSKDRMEELIKAATDLIYEIYPDMFAKKLKIVPGADSILKDIFTDGMKIGIVTSTPEEGMRHKRHILRTSGMDKLIEVLITADDVQHKKPAGEPLIICSQRLGVAPEKSVYVGDSRIDIKAGKAAGMKTIGVLTGFDDHEALGREKPDAIIESVAELPEVINFNHN
jgi:2-phosphoglycolate phosphatase